MMNHFRLIHPVSKEVVLIAFVDKNIVYILVYIDKMILWRKEIESISQYSNVGVTMSRGMSINRMAKEQAMKGKEF